MYNYTSNSVYLYKSIGAIIFVFIHECTYNYKRGTYFFISNFTSVYVQIYVLESYKRVSTLMSLNKI